MATNEELLAAAERIRSGIYDDTKINTIMLTEKERQCMLDLFLLGNDFAKQLTAPADVEAETRLYDVVDSILRTIDFVGVQNIKRERVAGMIRPLLRRGRADDGEPRSVPLNIVAKGQVVYRKEQE